MLTKNKEDMLKFKAENGKSVIPHGEYCYDQYVGEVDDSGIVHIKLCPYWDWDNELDNQNNGYCWFLENGDWNTNETAQLTNDKGEVVCAKDLPFPVGLLWDQCKECGINGSEDEEDLSDRDDQIGINVSVSGFENGVSINPCD